MGIEPIAGCLRGGLAPLAHASPIICGGRIRTGVGRLMRPCWNLPHTAYQTVASPPGPRPDAERPVRESNPSHLLDRQAVTPASSQGQQARTEGVEPSACGLEPHYSPRSTSLAAEVRDQKSK